MFDVEAIAKLLLNYLSNVMGSISPDEPDADQLKLIKKSSITAYAAGKTWGADIVASTENTIDDKVLEELLESCEDAAEKYEFSLDATQY